MLCDVTFSTESAADLHAQPLQALLGIRGEHLRKRRQDAVASFKQKHLGVARPDAVEILGERVARELGNSTGKLDTGRSAANDRNPHSRRWRLGSSPSRHVQTREEAGTDQPRVFDGFEARRVARPFLMREIRVRRPGRDDESVIGDNLVTRQNDVAGVGINRRDFAEHDFDARIAPQHLADRFGDVGRRERGSRHLIEKRLEQMIIPAIDEGRGNARLAELRATSMPAKPAP
jgi:hypothetical protein